ncbi:MAG: hypothetical protein AAB558_01095 [Patescibacteria group bacterium]
MTLKPPAGFVHDQRSQGWELLEEGPKVEGEPILDFLGFLREGETYINGETVLARALEMEGTESGQHHLERLLAQAASIPAELRSFYLVATGTKWRYPDGYVCVPYLRFVGGQWVLLFYGVGNDRWSVGDRVVRVCKQPGS